MTSLSAAFQAISPRLNPRATPWHSIVIHGAALVFFVALVAQAFVGQGVWAWSVGIAYVGYDTMLLLFVASRLLPLLRKTAEPAPSSAAPTLGVLVAARNEAAVLATAIDGLLAQSAPPDLILIADDGSDDGTADLLARRYGLAPPPLGQLGPPSPAAPSLRWLRLTGRGKAAALNAAIAVAETQVVVSVDADTRLDAGALAAMRAAFAADPDLVIGGGVLVPVCDGSLTGRLFQQFQIYEYIRNFISRYAWSRVDSLLLISGAFAGYRRDALVRVGGFDPLSLVEDYEATHRMHRYAVDHGLTWRVNIVGQARATTDSPARLMPFLRQRRRWFAGFLQTHYWYRDMTGTARYGALGLLMLPVKTFDTLQPLYGLAAFGLLAAFASDGLVAALVPAVGIMGAKIALDLSFYLVSIELYRRWTGARGGATWPRSILAALVEPFTFQLLRHAGAAWGWVAFLRGDLAWGRASRATPASR